MYSVVQRYREIGLRLASGRSGRRILLVLRDGCCSCKSAQLRVFALAFG